VSTNLGEPQSNKQLGLFKVDMAGTKIYMNNSRFLLRLSLISLCITSLIGCGYKYIHIEQADNIDELSINRITIIPFAADRMPSEEESKTATEGAATLTRLVEKELDRFYYLIDREKIEEFLSEIQPLEAQQIAKMLGRKMGIDAILMGLVNHYQPRKGNSYSVSQPASVAFELYLFDGEKGEVIWSASFDKTQKSLSEDLSNFSSFLKGEWKWLTAEELMEMGVNQILDKFPGMQDRKEQKKLKPMSSTLSLDLG